MIIAKKNENEIDFEKLPAGSYPAVCYGVWDIGLQTKTWQGQEKQVHRIIIGWEVNKLMESEGKYKGKRFVISNWYTLSLSDKAILRQHLESWRGKTFTPENLKGFDLEKLIGVNCLLSVIINEKSGKTNIKTVMKAMSGTPKMIPENNTEPPKWILKLQGKQTENPNVSDFDQSFSDKAEMLEDGEVPF